MSLLLKRSKISNKEDKLNEDITNIKKILFLENIRRKIKREYRNSEDNEKKELLRNKIYEISNEIDELYTKMNDYSLLNYSESQHE